VHLSLAVMLMAGLDGIQNRIDSGPPLGLLLANDVFSEGLIERWIDYKRGHEINPVRMRPHPIEFSMYFDA